MRRTLQTMRRAWPGVGIFLAGLLFAPGAGRAQEPKAVEFAAGRDGQIVFVTPSQNVECTYTPQGGTEVYKPADGGPELSCDRRDPKYLRFVLTPKSLKRFDNVGDASCCGSENPFAYGGRWSKGPFVCDSAESGLSCRRADGRGFIVSRERAELF